jgi:predicted histone-like DNA-binding protein
MNKDEYKAPVILVPKYNPATKTSDLLYGQLKRGRKIETEDISEDIAVHSSLGAGEILSVLNYLGKDIGKHLASGRAVYLRGLGTFKMSISSEGVESSESWSSNKIKKRYVAFTPDRLITRAITNAEFVRVKNTAETKNSANARVMNEVEVSDFDEKTTLNEETIIIEVPSSDSEM